MDRGSGDNRLNVRLPFRAAVSFMVMGDNLHVPGKLLAQAEAVDLSKSGLRICLKGQTVDVGCTLVVRVPVSTGQTTVPVLAQVKWVRKDHHGFSHAGLLFIT